ncbi:MAG: DUF4418 family protein [Clostridiales Family XIII bacterium]|nr:DUF4418 family protein [Clostridiales Family XIII bacterium]
MSDSKYKITVAAGALFLAFGAAIAVIPNIIYYFVETKGHMAMQCYETVVAETIVGAAIAVSGIAYLRSKPLKTKFYLSIAIAIEGIAALLFPSNWTSLCDSHTMACQVLTKPFIIVASVLLIATAVVGILLSAPSLKRGADGGASKEYI